MTLVSKLGPHFLLSLKNQSVHLFLTFLQQFRIRVDYRRTSAHFHASINMFEKDEQFFLLLKIFMSKFLEHLFGHVLLEIYLSIELSCNCFGISSEIATFLVKYISSSCYGYKHHYYSIIFNHSYFILAHKNITTMIIKFHSSQPFRKL